ncbi:MAG TPA: Lin1244/Lin1753 domain-containing protein [Dissulfurispiraceae bacterium]|nr:Lin1244/Lin1753 domain-containing protein [Dissulfurispiraceae bacterium]
MTRPRKNTVDYFPHSCDHGKTMFILEERYGNTGYAFWFKLLETLGSTEHHFINLNNESEIEYLRSKTRCEEGLVIEILTLLSRLGAIDDKLWQNKIVWSQNFVDGVSDVYTRSRHTLPPSKPDNYTLKPHVIDTSTQINPQSKVKESKVKESKVINTSLSETEITVSDGNGKYPPCPQNEIVNLYHKELPELPRVKHWPENLQVILRTRWKEDQVRQNLEWWEQFYRYVHESDFLMGRTKEAFVADLEWLIRPKNFTKIANGRYHGRGNLSTKPQPGITAWLAGRRENATT